MNREPRVKPFKIFLADLGEEIRRNTIDTWTGKMDELAARFHTSGMEKQRRKTKKVWWYK
jgi:hypothetical protein